jgi:hypothetical protein
MPLAEVARAPVPAPGHTMNRRLLGLAAVLLLISTWASAVATYQAAVTLRASNVYAVADTGILLLTRNCSTSAYGSYSTIYMDAASGTQDGQISFGDGSNCVVSGAYSPQQMPAGNTAVSLAFISNGLYVDTAQKLIAQADGCQSAYNGPATLTLSNSGLSYRDGAQVGSIQFTNGICFKACGLTGIYKLTDIATVAVPLQGPSLSNATVSQVYANGGNLTITASGAGTGYWMVQPAYFSVPTKPQIVAGKNGYDATPSASGSVAMAAGSPVTVAISGLMPSTNYSVYFVAKSPTGQTSATPSVVSFSTPSGNAPPIPTPVPTAVPTPNPLVTPTPTTRPPNPSLSNVVIGKTETISLRANRAILSTSVDQDAEGYWMIVPGDTVPSVSLVVAGLDATGKPAPIKGYGPLKANTPINFAITDLQPGRSYTLAFAARNAGGAMALKTTTFQTPYASAPQPPITPDTGWYWNPSEGGRGFSLEANASGNIFLAGFMYDAAGSPIWYVSTLSRDDQNSQFAGDLLYYEGGQHLAGSWHSPSNVTKAGKVSLTPTSKTTGTLKLEGNGLLPQVTNIERFPINNGAVLAPMPGSPQTGWWWNAGEGGRGYFIELQDNYAFIAAYMYDTDGKPAWYVSQDRVMSSTLYQGALAVYGRGQTLGGRYASPVVMTSNAGNIVLKFFSATSGQLILPSGITVAIERYTF